MAAAVVLACQKVRFEEGGGGGGGGGGEVEEAFDGVALMITIWSVLSLAGSRFERRGYSFVLASSKTRHLYLSV